VNGEKLKRGVQVLTLALSVTCIAQANTVNIIAPGANTESVYSVSGFVANGATMAGLLEVTVNFVGGGSSSAFWMADCGPLCGEAQNAIGNGVWKLTETDDTGHITGIVPDTTADHPWTLSSTSTNVAISSVVLSTFGTMVFDRDLNSNGQEGTPRIQFRN
jgi:hypothetical protein